MSTWHFLRNKLIYPGPRLTNGYQDKIIRRAVYLYAPKN